MSDKPESKLDRPLDKTMIASLAEAMAPAEDATDSIARIRAKLMQSIDNQPQATRDFVTIRSDDDVIWIKMGPKVEKKVLHIDPVRGIETYLLRLQPGAVLPTHAHDADEHCIVMEGEVEIDDVQLHAGDYHLAPKGSVHRQAHSRNGALLMLQSALAA